MNSRQRIQGIITLMMIGEGVFLMPFVFPRIFRPTFLKVFDVTNLELGGAFSVYGVTAMFSYLFGGPIADKFSSKKLLIISMLVTLVGSAFMIAIPSLLGLTILYGFWGFSTILLFWSAYTKMTRIMGGEDSQGLAFGSVDAGRGLFAALLASFSVILFSYLLPFDPEQATKAEITNGLIKVIYVFCGLIALGALMVWLYLPDLKNDQIKSERFSWTDIKALVNRKSIWLHAVIILCGYVGYKCTDVFSLYASDAMGFNDVQAAHVGTIAFWARPIAAVIAGFLGDRHQISKLILICFGITIFGCLMISSGLLIGTNSLLIFLNIAVVCAGIYGVRGLYYALLEEGNVPLKLTGSAVGFVSVIGYTPDIFMGPLIGVVLDGNPGELGHQYLFGILAAFGFLGFLTTLAYRKTESNVHPV